MSLIKEFKEFAVKGNMMDIAIGVIIGASFNKVVDVLVKQILMPPLSLLTNGINFENKKIILRKGMIEDGVTEVQEVAIAYGSLFEVTLDFLIVGLTIFLVVKFINVLRNRAEDPKDVTIKTPKDIELLNELTELIREQNRLLESKS
jgi:large conductance mechanosensitive channel|tara:strand:+ start:362 stop:802 length:441 start_codon:yes stop_codon:yes gene_type:complete